MTGQQYFSLFVCVHQAKQEKLMTQMKPVRSFYLHYYQITNHTLKQFFLSLVNNRNFLTTSGRRWLCMIVNLAYFLIKLK